MTVSINSTSEEVRRIYGIFAASGARTEEFPLIQLPRKSEASTLWKMKVLLTQFPLIQLPRKSEVSIFCLSLSPDREVSINSTSEEVRSLELLIALKMVKIEFPLIQLPRKSEGWCVFVFAIKNFKFPLIQLPRKSEVFMQPIFNWLHKKKFPLIQLPRKSEVWH